MSTVRSTNQRVEQKASAFKIATTTIMVDHSKLRGLIKCKQTASGHSTCFDIVPSAINSEMELSIHNPQ